MDMTVTTKQEVEEAQHVVEHADAEKEVFVLIGLCGAGKSTAAEMIAEEHDEPVTTFEMSDYVRTQFWDERVDDEDQIREDVNDNALGEWAAKEKDKHGQDYFARSMAETIKAPHAPHIAISGVRSPEEAVAINDVFEDAHVTRGDACRRDTASGAAKVTTVAVWTLPDLRFERKYGGQPSTNHDDWDTFTERNERELWDWGAVEFFASGSMHEADYIIPNHDDMDTLRENVRFLLDDKDWYDVNPFPVDDFETVAQYL